MTEVHGAVDAGDNRPVQSRASARADERLAFLIGAGQELASSLDYATTLSNVAHLVVPRLADWCVIDVVEDDGSIDRLAVAHSDPERERWAREMSRRYPPAGQNRAQSAQVSEPQLVPVVTEEMLTAGAYDEEHLAIILSLGIHSAMSVPMVARGRTVGLITFMSTESDRRFGPEDLEIAKELSRTGALAVDNARLYRAAQAAQEEAEAQRRHLHTLFMQAPAVIGVFRGPEHICELVNPRYIEIAGDREYLGRPIRDVMKEAESQGLVDLLDRVYGSGEPYEGREYPLVFDREGTGALEERIFHLVFQPVIGASSDVEGVMVHAVEVTEGVRARQQVEQLAAEREAILGQMADGVSILDADGRVIFINEAGARITGVARLGRHIEEYIQLDHVMTAEGEAAVPEETALIRALRGETVINSISRLRRPDGIDIVIQASAAPVRAENGRSLGAVTTFRDITEQFTLERQKDDFLTAAAHDLKTPLASMKGLAQILLRRAGDEEPRMLEGLRRIDSTASRMATLVDDLLDVTRINMGRPLDLARETVDLVSLAREAVAESGSMSADHDIVIQAAEGALHGEWDAQRLTRAITNLISNAVRYSPDGGTVHLRIEREGDDAVLSVHDEGIGIPLDELPHVFERFYRARNVAGRVAGTGIGLASVKQIVEQHGGTVTVTSREGDGSTFTIRLPLEPA